MSEVLGAPPPVDPCNSPILTPICAGTSVAQGVVGSVANSAWDAVVHSIAQGVADATKALVTLWTQIPSPADQLDTPGSAQVFLRQSTGWYVTALAVAAVFVAAARMALTQRGDAGSDLGKVMLRLVFTTAIGVPLIQGVLLAGDGYSQWVLDRAGGDSLGLRLTALWTGAVSSGMSSGLLFVVALVTLLATLAQIVMMLVRVGVVILLTGLWPLSASMSNTETGHQWWQRSNGWLLAFAVYKPAGATVYATAFTMMGTGKDLTAFLAGTAMLVLAVVTLPALLRLAVPAVAAASAGGSGGVAAAAGGAIATGAMATGRLLGRGLESGSPAGGSRPGAAPTGAIGPGPSGGDGRAGSPGPTGGPGSTGGSGSSGTSGNSAGAGGGTAGPGSTGAAGGAGTASVGASGAAAGTAAPAAAAAGPVGAVVAGAVIAGKAVTSAVKDAGNEATGAKST